MSANAVSTIPRAAVPATQDEGALIEVLRSSLYPGAREESVKLVLGYCRAAGLDPIQKPVHIVPMRVKVGKDYQWRDTVMPGIGLYRTQAARTGSFAGISEPEFGPTKTLAWSDEETGKSGSIEYPEWCRITVRRLVQGVIAEFTATEFWIENYATAGRGTNRPNEMWSRRSRGQLAKCCEAQALRRAFPEVGAQPTAEEFEGREFVDADDLPGATEAGSARAAPRRRSQAAEVIDVPASAQATGASEPPPAADAGERKPVQPPPAQPDGAGATSKIGAGEVMWLRSKAKSASLDDAALLEIAGGAASIEDLTIDQFKALRSHFAR